MRKTLLAFALLVLVSACGGGGGEADEATGGAEALGVAAEACGSALATEDGAGDADIVREREQAADRAAEAAESDARWSELARATSDYAVTTDELVEATRNIESLPISAVQALGDRTAAAVRDIKAACREVKAAGGEFAGL